MADETNQPFQESNLDSAEYRDRLMRKLNCLIAVLEVAKAKVKKSLSGPKPDVARLRKIQANLSSKLEVCQRARRALERRERPPEGLAREPRQRRSRNAQAPKTSVAPRPCRSAARFEMSSSEEHARFTLMGKISPAEILACNFEDLANKLQD